MHLPTASKGAIFWCFFARFFFSTFAHISTPFFKRCVEYLVAHGSDLFLENYDGLSPCDLAVRENHHDIALFLESRMVFNSTEDLRSSSGSFEEAETTEVSGLRSQDLQEAKEQLIAEVADTLSLSVPSAESLLRHNEWSRESVMDNHRQNNVSESIIVQPSFIGTEFF